MHKREKIIGDFKYSLLLPPVRQAMPLCAKVAVLIGPTLATLGEDATKGGMSQFGSVLSAVDPIKLDKLVMEAVVASKLSCNSKPISTEIDFERHFSEHREKVYQITLWVLWECVRDFFPQAETFIQMFKTNLGKEL